MKDYRLGEVVQLTEAKSVWGLGTVPKGTKGVVVRRPGALSGGYEVRLDRSGRRVELPGGALDKTGGWWAGVVPAQSPRERKAAPRPRPAPGPEAAAPKALVSSTPPAAARVPWRARSAGVRDHGQARSPWAPARRPPTASAERRGGPAPDRDHPPGAAAAENLAQRLRAGSRAMEPHDQMPTEG